jgi:hypothetical protein
LQNLSVYFIFYLSKLELWCAEALSLCLPVLQMFSKLSKQMREKKYHPALKTLEQLESTHLPRIANYR